MKSDPCAIVPLPSTTDPAAAFAAVAGRPALVCVVSSLLGHVKAARIAVVTSPQLVDPVRQRLRAADLGAVGLTVAGELPSRRQTLITGLQFLGVEADSSIPVLIGDPRHPLTTAAVTGLVLSGVREGNDVVVPVLPVTDTVKTVDGGGAVLGTVDRASLRTMQYPRGFTGSALWKTLLDDEIASDDELVVALRAGLAIGIVDGDAHARAVQLPRDGHLVDAIIGSRPA